MSPCENSNEFKMCSGENGGRSTHGGDHSGGVSLFRPGSPYPRALINAHLQTGSDRVVSSSRSQALSEPNINQQGQPRAPSFYEGLATRPSRDCQRTTSIQWAKNLPVPNRKLSPSFFNEPTSSPEARRASFQYNNSCTNDEIIARNPGYFKYIAEQRAYIVRKNFEKTRRKREARIAAKRQAIQDNEEDMTSVEAVQKASAAEYIPPHKRTAKAKAEVANQEHITTTSCYAESDTESSGDYANPHIPLSESVKKSTPLTIMALMEVPEREGVFDKSKMSHQSMDVSVGDEVSLSDEYGSSRFSNPSDKLVGIVSLGKVSHSFKAWLETLSVDCIISSLGEIDNHHKHDVDPTNGQLLDQIDQPDTIVDIEEEIRMTPAMIHRRRDWTSNLVIHREITIRQNLMRRQQEETQRKRRNLPVIEGCASIENQNPSNTIKTAIMPISNEKKLLADCVLRPVQLSDAKGCAEIYNAAVADHDHQIPDTNPVSAQRFEFIITECQREKLPFVVATVQKADLCDVKNWPSLDAYRQYMRWKKSQKQEDEPPEITVYGFAFLKPYERGIGGLTGTASPAVKATVFVNPEHRRGGIGSALLHQLLTQTSILYYGNVECKWNDPAAGEDAFHTPGFRNVHRIFIHTMINNEIGQGLKWMDNLMSSFHFEKAGRLNQVYKVDTPHGIEWYDQVVWQHWANKIDTVRTFYVGDESECSYDYPGKSYSPWHRRAQSSLEGEESCYSNGYDSDNVFDN